MICPHCQDDARCVDRRSRQVLSLVGPLRLERHYYHCAACRQGSAPFDTLLRLQSNRFSPAAREAVCIAGMESSFAASAERALVKLAGLHVSESTVERTCEAVGTAVGARRAAGETFGPDRAWAWHQDADGKSCAVVSVDATGVGQQGPRGAKALGRMVYVGMVYNPVPKERDRWANPDGRQPPWQVRYATSLEGGLHALGTPLRNQGRQVGMDEAERWLAISDGGAGLEEFLRVHFPRVEAVILDYFHVAERLYAFAHLWHAGDEVAGKEQGRVWGARLQRVGGGRLREELAGLDLRGRSAAVRAMHRELTTYFGNQEQRMDYPRYLAKGWPIGSGPIEAACKLVIGERLKGSGMRWGAAGADAVAHLRALYRSETSQWDAFWTPLAA